MSATIRRLDGWTVRGCVAAALLLAVYPSNRLMAQDSQFGIRGLGTPGKSESVRARSTGGAFAPFDPFSPLLDASLADVRRITAGVIGATSWRSVDAGGANASLRGTRFPAFVLAGPITKRITLGGGFATYLDRTFGVLTQDTIVLRGVPEPISDELRSDGAISDLRLAAATRLRSWLAVGAGIHLITGSTRVSAIRRFNDSTTYRNSTSRDEVAYGGRGASLSALADITQDLRLAIWGRSDTRLRASIGGVTKANDDLPLSYGAGIRWHPGSQVGLAGAVAWHKWAAGSSPPPNSHDTFEWSLGTELGPPGTPLRFGARRGQLPFGIGKAPTEFGIAGGLGKVFSGGRGRLDIGVERLDRKGSGLNERVWTLLLGLTVRP